MQLQLGSRLLSDFFIAFDEYVGRWKGFMAPLSKPLATVLLSNNFVWQTAIEMLPIYIYGQPCNKAAELKPITTPSNTIN